MLVVLQPAVMIWVAQGSLKELLHEVLLCVASNALFLNFVCHDIGNVVAALQPPSISPSLWALKIEIGFYLIFPFLWIAVRRYGGWALAAIFIPSAIYSFILSRLDMTELGRQLPGRLT